MRTFLSIFAILFFGASFAQKNSDKPHSLGTIYPSEWTTYKDALSGIDIKVLTDTTSNDSYIYQTDCSFAPSLMFCYRAQTPKYGVGFV